MHYREAGTLKRIVRKVLRDAGFEQYSFDRGTNRMAGFLVTLNLVHGEPPRGVLVMFLGYDKPSEHDLLHRAKSVLLSHEIPSQPHLHPFCHPPYLHVAPRGKGTQHEVAPTPG